MLLQLLHHIYFDAFDICALVPEMGGGEFQGLGKTYDPIEVFRSGAHIPFLGAAMYKGMYLDILIDIKQPYSFRAMEFMSRPRNKMDRRIPQIEREMSHGLYGIGMKKGAIQFAQFPYGMNIQHIADLIIGVHQRYEGLFLAGRQFLLQVFQIDVPIGQQGYIAERSLAFPMKMLHRMQRGMMFQGRSNDMGASQVPDSGRNSRIGTFRTAGSKKYFCRMGIQDLRHRFARI